MSGGASRRAADPIADAIDAMNKAAETLAKTAAGADGAPTDPPHDAARQQSSVGSREAAEEERRFYRHLEERGELVDVGDASEIEKLPPQVTHVRYRDGRVERIGFP